MIVSPSQAVRMELSPKVLWTICGIALVSGFWQIYMFFTKWEFLLDMEVYRAGGRAFLDNQSLYFESFNVRGVVLPFIYPPFGAAILSPFALVSSEVAAAFVLAMSTALTFVCIYAIAQALIANRLHAFTFACVMWPLALLSEPHTMNASFGQINVLVMALCVLDLVPRKRWLPQGTLIGIAAAIKLTPVALCLFFLLRKDFRAIGWAVVSGVVVTAITACFRLTATIEFYTDTIFKMNSTSEAGVSTAYLTNQSIKGMLARWAPSEQAAVAHQGLIDILWLVFVVIAIVAVARLMIMMFRRDMIVDAALANAGLMLIISPISWSHHWVWMPLFAMVLLFRWLTTAGNPVLLGICAGATWLFCLQIKPHWIFGDLNAEMFHLSILEKLVLSGYLWLMVFIVVSLFVVMRGNPAPSRVD
ncbi:Polyprenol-phosphate-mannose-dependent alpha-(1-2)-phosphatidylinositol mannoside mannosyltransferase [Corynebacterium kalinowskii]|uniref:Polyprenol-phosphate-mannose-dependent alpha-(1-2)-phosphatidylinositol mannoside mannosyltransferase n=1 Tax=Corynebacterium kalinowskii TaxID=2675216 RepID=A0A6B8VSX6_9CORY|nr:glycosyltransferase family 87 protein [Corynebacterium kalinowskii]QGU01836.1 Polyprenol-phosphate-mannose-dependent alpha-(1-2)-phosphatidylinositol mannoside mannosyltransferase [Corynebacterium kalinowskii]